MNEGIDSASKLLFRRGLLEDEPESTDPNFTP